MSCCLCVGVFCDWTSDWLIDCLVDWLIDCLLGGLIGWLIGVVRLIVCCLSRSFYSHSSGFFWFFFFIKFFLWRSSSFFPRKVLRGLLGALLGVCGSHLPQFFWQIKLHLESGISLRCRFGIARASYAHLKNVSQTQQKEEEDHRRRRCLLIAEGSSCAVSAVLVGRHQVPHLLFFCFYEYRANVYLVRWWIATSGRGRERKQKFGTSSSWFRLNSQGLLSFWWAILVFFTLHVLKKIKLHLKKFVIKGGIF